MKHKKTLLLLVLAAVATVASAQPKVKNIIFMIGDGMGMNQVYAGMTANDNRLNLEQCTHTGWSKTYSASSYITDSAAGGTALACGKKTKNGMVGMDADSVPIFSTMHVAKQNGMATGFVVTCTAQHATPASFYAHQRSRKMYNYIAEDLVNSEIDVFVGGGRDYMEKRSDERNLTDSLRKKGYQIAYKLNKFKTIENGKVAALLADGDLPKRSLRGKMLPEAVEKTISLLNQHENGFFMMVEGSQIDYGGHANEQDYVVSEMLDFDEAIGKAIDFAKADGETLVIVTADHETGAMTIKSGDFKKKKVELVFNRTGHSGVPVPVFAFGPGAELFTGFMENSDMKAKCLQLLGIEAE